MLKEITEGAIKNGPFRDTGNKTQNKQKTKHNTEK